MLYNTTGNDDFGRVLHHNKYKLSSKNRIYSYLVNSEDISFEKIQLATEEQSRSWFFNSLSINTINIC